MDLQKALREGPNYLRNAEDALARNITNPDMLYMWDNQVAAIDSFLANTEPLNGESSDLTTLREELRDRKRKLERKVMEFEATQEGEEVPDEPPADELVQDFKDVAGEIIAMADAALKEKVTDVKQLPVYEDPRELINGFLADTEPHKSDKELGKVRTEIRKRKDELDTRIHAIESDWRQRDLAGGDDSD